MEYTIYSLLTVLIVAVVSALLLPRYFVRRRLTKPTVEGSELPTTSVTSPAKAPATGPPAIAVGETTPYFDWKDVLDAENAMRSTALTAITAAVVVVGAFLTFTQLVSNEGAAHEQIRLTNDQVRLTRVSQNGQQFTQAVGQLGSNQQPTRLGGVYSLVQLWQSAEEFKNNVPPVLASYIVEEAPKTAPGRTNPGGPLVARDPSLQLALSALGKELADSTRTRVLNLSLQVSDADSLYLGGATLLGNFARVNLKYDGLNGAVFYGTDLSGACLLGSGAQGADFRNANLSGANLLDIADLGDAKFNKETKYDDKTKWPKEGRFTIKDAEKERLKLMPETAVRPSPCTP